MEGTVINALDPVEELYDLYSDKEASPCIVEIGDNRLGFNLDIGNGPADLYLEL